MASSLPNLCPTRARTAMEGGTIVIMGASKKAKHRVSPLGAHSKTSMLRTA